MTPARLASAKKLAAEAANGKTKLLDANQLLDRASACIEALLKELEQAQNPDARFSAAQVAAMLEANKGKSQIPVGEKPSAESVRATARYLEQQVEKAKVVNTERTPSGYLGVMISVSAAQVEILHYVARTWLDWED